MIAALLLAAAVPVAAPATVIEAERAFAADAQTLGQWTAFRKWASPSATMFAPDAVKAQDWLKDRADPPVAIRWAPSAGFAACDGWLAATTGSWSNAWGQGYFSTVWSIANPDRPRWRWDVDAGDSLPVGRPAVAEPVLRKATCSTPRGEPAWPALPDPDRSGHGTVAGGASGDRTLQYRWYVSPKARGLAVALWNGTAFEIVIDDRVATPPAPKPR